LSYAAQKGALLLAKAFFTDRILSAPDLQRALNTLQKLLRHDISDWALAGGFVVEIHCLRAGLCHSIRPLNDIDFVAAGLDCAPETLSRDFLVRHVHPLDPPGKTILQLVDAEAKLRIDLFRAYATIMARALPIDSPFGPIQLISAEDALAHAARLLLDLRVGIPVPSKYASDYLRLARIDQLSDVEIAWPDHRKPDHPTTFAEANSVIRSLIATHDRLLVTPEYSNDATQICPRCVAIQAFPLADPDLIRSLLGYC